MECVIPFWPFWPPGRPPESGQQASWLPTPAPSPTPTSPFQVPRCHWLSVLAPSHSRNGHVPEVLLDARFGRYYMTGTQPDQAMDALLIHVPSFAPYSQSSLHWGPFTVSQPSSITPPPSLHNLVPARSKPPNRLPSLSPEPGDIIRRACLGPRSQHNAKTAPSTHARVKAYCRGAPTMTDHRRHHYGVL